MTPLDRVESLVAGERATAVRHVPHTLPVFESHFPRFPVLPGVMIIEDLVAVANLVLDDGPWRLAGADRVRYRHFVRPGDVLRLDVDVTSRSAGTATCSATARVDGRTVTTVRTLSLHRVEKGEFL